MSSFAPRLTEAGIWNNPYWYDLSINPGAKDHIWLPNCTTYAYGRSAEAASYGGGTVDYNTIFGGGFPSAANWYANTVWTKTWRDTIQNQGSSRLLLGDILCWGSGGGVGTDGHVAVVEEIIDQWNVRISQSHYAYTTQTISNPGTGYRRYFEVARWNIQEKKMYREYYYNPNGSGPDYATISVTNLRGAIHNPYAPQNVRNIIPILMGYNLRKKKGGTSIVRL